MTPEDFVSKWNWHGGLTREQLLYQIRAIQLDALREAAEIAKDSLYTLGRKPEGIAAYTAILARIKELEKEKP